MTTTEYLKKQGIKGSAKLSEADRKRLCSVYLSSFDYEFNLPSTGTIEGSRMVDHHANELGIKIDWRG